MKLANCPCVAWCRLWEETQGGKLPPSEHAPGCEHYKLETFTVLEFDGTRCVMEPHEAEAYLRESEETYNVSTIQMTRDQFNGMGDFAGF